MIMDFGSVAQDYAQGRPKYPSELFRWLASITPSTEKVWDCGCGSGQATIGLAQYFDHIIATDIAEKQIVSAPKHPTVEFFIAPAETCKTENSETPLIPNDSVDLVNVGIAAHWFKLDDFYNQALRVLKPNGILSLLVYGEPSIENESINKQIQTFIQKITPYVLPENKHTKAMYKSLPFPFIHELEMPKFHMKASMTVRQLTMYFHSRSTITNFIEREGYDPVVSLEQKLSEFLSAPDEQLPVRWPLSGRIAKISALEKDLAALNRIDLEDGVPPLFSTQEEKRIVV